MMTAADWDDVANTFAEMINDNPTEIIIRRGSATLPAQTVRIARQGSSAVVKQADGAQEVRGRVVVLGSALFEVQPGDRVNDGYATLFQVTFVRPNRRGAVVAEAEAVG